MYGYVRPPAGILSEEELERFRRMYCGLCHTLGQRYGTAARFILNYDFTYLAILLSGGDEGPSTAARCMVSPLKKRDYLCTTDALALAADESVILAYWQLRDGVADHDWLHGMKYRSLSAILEPAYRKASAARPAFAESTRRQLAHLAELEAQPCALLDPPADAFASLLGAAAQEVDHPVRRRVLEQLLYHLGRWIYLIDARDDLEEDRASGCYNPVRARYGEGGDDQALALTLEHSLNLARSAFCVPDFGCRTPVLENILYLGLPMIQQAVFDGSWSRLKKEKIWRKPT